MAVRRSARALAPVLGILLSLPPTPAVAATPVTERVSMTAAGGEALSPAGQQLTLTLNVNAHVSRDGRYVVFESAAPNLVPNDTNGRRDIFLRDRLTGTIERVSVSSAGAEANDHSSAPRVTPDGRFVVFASDAENLVANDTNQVRDVFIRDRQTGVTERISVSSAGVEGDDNSGNAHVSADGRYVVFESAAANLVAGDSNAATDVFIRDRRLGITERVSVDSAGAQGDNGGSAPRVSDDGRFVVFVAGDGLVAGETNATSDVLIRDRQAGTTTLVSVSTAGAESNAGADRPDMSPDGRFVVFESASSNLVPGDTNGVRDVFVRDRRTGATERISVSTAGAQADLACGGDAFRSAHGPAVSPDGRFVAFECNATNLVSGDTNGLRDIFLRDRQSGTTTRVNVTTTGAQATGGLATGPSISADGRFVVFQSAATNLVANDTNAASDIFLRGPLFDVPTSAPAAPTEMALPATASGGSLVTTLPVRLPASGIVTVPVTLVGSGASLGIPAGTVVTTADGKPFSGRLFPPSPRIDAAVEDAYLFTSSEGPLLRFAAPATSAADGVSGPLTLALPFPPGAALSSVRVVRTDPSTGAITTLPGTLSADGTKLTFRSATLGTFAVAERIDLARAAAAPSVTSELPVRFPRGGLAVPAVTLAGGGALLAIPARTAATVRDLNAPFEGVLAPPMVAAPPPGVLSAHAFAANVPSGVRFDRTATITLPVPSGVDNGAVVPVAVTPGGATTCLRGTFAGSDIATEVTTTGTYALIGPVRSEVAGVERASAFAPGYHAQWVGQSASATLCPRQHVDVTVRLRNTGDLAWIRGTPSQVVLGSSAPPDNTRDFDRGVLVFPLYGRDRYATTAEEAVRPGEVGTFTFRLQAPAASGVHRTYLRAVVEGVVWLEDEGIYWEMTVR